MSLKTTLLAATAIVAIALPAFAGGIEILDSYARSSGVTAQSGAAFLTIRNTGDTDERLIAVASDAAARVELHTHLEDENGVMRMREVEGGFAIPAGGDHILQRGGDHIMFMGLTGPFVQDEMVTVTLTFESAGALTVEIPVDNARMPMMGTMDQGDMGDQAEVGSDSN